MPNNQQKKTNHEGDSLTPIQSQAELLKQTSASAVLATCLGKTFGKVVESAGFKTYFDLIMVASGQPTDPIERMFIEQTILAHHRICDLHAQSACAENAEVAAVYNAAALRLMAEFRKSSLALREFRSPVATPKLTVVRQQNVAGGNQQIAFVESKDIQQQPEKNDSRSRLASKKQEAISYEPPIDFLSKSAAGSSRSAEPIETRKNQQCRTPAPPGGGTDQQTVAAVNWPENREREKAFCG